MKKKLFGYSFVLASFVALLLFATPSQALDIYKCNGSGANSSICNGGTGDSIGTVVTNIISILMYVLGFVAVIVIVIGGIMYATAAGDANRLKAAKDTILYAAIGVAVAILAQVIVQFVVRAFI